MNGVAKITDEQLIRMLVTDDPKWPAALYDNFASMMYGVIFRIVADEKASEEVMKEAFQRIKTQIPHYDASHGKLFTWILNICRTIALNRKIEHPVHTYFHEPPFHGVTEKLENDYRVLVELLFIRGYSQVEVAEELNIPLGTVKARSRAALQKLRTLIQKEKSEWTLKNT